MCFGRSSRGPAERGFTAWWSCRCPAKLAGQVTLITAVSRRAVGTYGFSPREEPMFRGVLVRRIPVAGAALVGAFVVTGCAAKVTRKDFDAELVKLREEMQASDRQLSGRVDSVSSLSADHQRRLDALEQELQALRKEYNVSIERMQGMLKFNVPVHFEFDRADIRESDRPVLDRFAAVVREHYSEAVITVEGFADPSGSAAYNRRLGMRRGDAVREYLAGSGELVP